MFKPTAPLHRRLRRLALTTKQAGKGYYKGTGSGSMGRHTKHGGYQIEWHKVRTYVVPDLSDTMLTPFVATRIERTRGEYKTFTAEMKDEHGDYEEEIIANEAIKSPRSGLRYFLKWKQENGVD
ncbi:MAG: hypothetical protein M1820_000245 [Bogoriella megaspora]|nr:MAG: hypothetical protein M1820_000245 [Bogoriella megaspora]